MYDVPAAVIDRARAFIAANEWVFAKTMPRIPHFYARRHAAPSVNEFEWMVIAIRQHGDRRRWGPYNHHYLEVDGWKYWTMGWPPAQTTIINRAGPNDESIDELLELGLIAEAPAGAIRDTALRLF